MIHGTKSATRGTSIGRGTPTVMDRDVVVAPIKGNVQTRGLGGVTAIIPCFNEEACILNTIEQVRASLTATGRPFEIIVVDDGSKDDTPARLEEASAERDVRVVRNEINRGYGFSLKRAVGESAHDIIVITDADGTYPNERIEELVAGIEQVDMVVGARTGSKVHVPLLRRPAKWTLTRLASYLAGTRIPDLNSGLRVMRKPLIKRFQSLLPDGFSFTTTITLALLTHGYKVEFVPIDYAKRVGRSSIRPIRDTLNFISLIVRTVMYFKPLKVFGPASAILLGLAALLAVVTRFVFGTLADVSVLVIAMASLQVLGIGLLADLIDKRFPVGGVPTDARE